MMFRSEQIGQRWNRFEVRYLTHEDVATNATPKALGGTPTRDGSEELADAWRKHADAYSVWVVDLVTGKEVAA